MTEVRPLRAYAEIALGRQRAPQHEQGPHMVPYLRAANVKDGSLDLSDVKEMNFSPSEQKIFSLRPDDVLVTEGSGSLGAVGASTVWSGEVQGPVCFQNTLLRLRPRPGTDPRFLAWWCRYAFSAGVFASIATGANIFHVSAERVRDLPLTYRAPMLQRAIADFLDAETARIDALIAKKRELRNLLRQRRQAAIDAMISVAEPLVAVRYLTGRVTSGPRGWSDRVSDAGRTPFLRLTNIQRDDIELDMSDVVFVDVPATAEARRTAVRDGDVLLSITADIGSVAIARAEHRGANVSQHIALLSPTHCVPEWLAFAICSSAAQAQLEAGRYGGTKTQLSLGDIGDLRLPVADVDIQRGRLQILHGMLGAIHRAAVKLERQIALLQEHRQALITAAVTGELDIPGVAELDIPGVAT